MEIWSDYVPFDIILSIPFIGEASITFSKQIVSIIKTSYNIEILPVFTSSKFGDYFSLKCRTPFPLSSNVVYKFSCLRDAGCSYIQGCHYLLETWKNLETLENLENGHFGAKNLENGDFDQKINDKKPGKLHSGFYFSQM